MDALFETLDGCRRWTLSAEPADDVEAPQATAGARSPSATSCATSTSTSRPAREGIDRYVGLEHLDPRLPAHPSDGAMSLTATTFTQRFQPGTGAVRQAARLPAQGRHGRVRRHLLRRHLRVRADGRSLLPELLPFIVPDRRFLRPRARHVRGLAVDREPTGRTWPRTSSRCRLKTSRAIVDALGRPTGVIAGLTYRVRWLASSAAIVSSSSTSQAGSCRHPLSPMSMLPEQPDAQAFPAWRIHGRVVGTSATMKSDQWVGLNRLLPRRKTRSRYSSCIFCFRRHPADPSRRTRRDRGGATVCSQTTCVLTAVRSSIPTQH